MNVIKVMALLTLAALSGCTQETKNEVEAFIVTGAGNGIPLSGREIVALNETFLPKISVIKAQYNQELDSLITNAIENNKLFQEKIDSANLLIEALKKEIPEVSVQINDEIKMVQAKLSSISEGDNGDVKREIDELKIPLVKKKTELLADQKHINIILKKYELKTNKFKDSIAKKSQIVKSNNESIELNGIRISKLVSAYIIDNEISETLPSETIRVKEVFSQGDEYSIRNPMPKYSFQVHIALDKVSKTIGKALSSKVDPLMIDTIKAQVANDALYEDISSLATKLSNSIVPINNLYKDDKILAKYAPSKYSDIDERLQLASTELELQISQTTQKIKKMNSPDMLAALLREKKAELTNEIAQKEKALSTIKSDVQYQIDSLNNKLMAEEESLISDEKRILVKEYDDKLTAALLESIEYTAYTGLNGRVVLPRVSSFLYMTANRMSDEEFTWLIKPDFSVGKQILANHNIAHRDLRFGVWVFDYLARDLQVLKSKT